MRLSYFTMPLHPPGRVWRETLAEDREAVLLAERLGYAEAFVGEHVTDRAETVTNCLVFLASLAHDTTHIVLGSGTVNLPNRHPAQVAADVAMLDHLLGGRFVFGISPGGLRSDAEVFGNLDQDRRAMFEEAIAQVLAIWAGGPPYDLAGRYWQLSTRRTQDAAIGQGEILRPLQQPHPPIMVACMSPSSAAAADAARRDWSIVSANFLQPVWLGSHAEKLAEGWAAAGHAPRRDAWRVARSLFVADDAATARRYAYAADGPYGHYYRSLMRKLVGNGRPDLFKTHREMPDGDITLDFVLRSLVIAGTPDEVAARVIELREAAGEFGTLVYAGHDWAEPALARRSMELMAHAVMPAVNRELGE